MSATLAEAFEQVDASELERQVMMELSSFEGLSAPDLARLARMIHSRFPGAPYQDAEDAVQQAAENILRKTRRGKVDLEEVDNMGALIYGYAKWHMLTIVSRRGKRNRWLSSDRLKQESHYEPGITPDLGARVLLQQTSSEIDRLLKTTGTLTQDISEMTGVRRALIERRRMYLGIDRRCDLRVWDKDQILDAFKGFFAEHGRAPKANNDPLSVPYFPSATLVKEAFGSWRAATEAAGLKVNSRTMGVERVARQIHAWYERTGRWPSSRECDGNTDLPSTTAVRAYFGTCSPRKAAPAVVAALGLAGGES